MTAATGISIHGRGFEEFDESYLHEKGVVMGNWSYRKTIAPL